MRILDMIQAKVGSERREKEMTVQKKEISTIWSEDECKRLYVEKHPLPQMKRENWVSLNGPWHYAITGSGNRPEKFDGMIEVPFSPECAKSGVERTLLSGEFLWYFRTVRFGEIEKGKRLILHFQAVDERCIVWWNGKMLGSHRNGYLPFSFDVTEYVHTGNNTIWLRVQDDTERDPACRGKQTLKPGGMFYTAQSGIWQSVWMEWVPENYVEELRITPMLDAEKIQLEMVVDRAQRMTVEIHGELFSSFHRIEADEFISQEIIRDGDLFSKYILKKQFDVAQVRMWSPEDPFLYSLTIRFGDDVVDSYFAMRKFSVGKDAKGYPRLMLNNEPYFMNGVLDQGYWPESLYTAPCEEAMIFDIKLAKKTGFNMIRKHLKIEPMRWYYHCDRIGMIVWQDMINGGSRLDLYTKCYLPTALPQVQTKIKDNHYRFFGRSDEAARTQWEEDLYKMIRYLYNVPCIAMWVPFNEGWGQFDALRISKKVKRMDPTRLVDHASGWYDQGGGDVKSVHNYFRKLVVQREKRPFVLSEYGGFTCVIDEHAGAKASYGYRNYATTEELTEAFENVQKRIYYLEQKGLAAAVFTQLSDIEEEMNGIVTYDRKQIKILRE